jgi:hypothetical protein
MWFEFLERVLGNQNALNSLPSKKRDLRTVEVGAHTS